jgi:hypothetical protein
MLEYFTEKARILNLTLQNIQLRLKELKEDFSLITKPGFLTIILCLLPLFL